VFADRAVAPEFPRENSLSQAENRQNEQPMKSPAKPSVAKNVLSNWGSFLFGAIISFFLAPFIVRHLGDVGYGVWTLLTSLTGYLGLLDMGVRGAVTRYVARFHAQDKKEELQGIVSSGLVVFVTAGLVAIFISVLLAFFGIQHFQVPAEYRATARIVLIIAGVNVAVSLIAGVFGGVVVGLQRFDLTNTVEVTITAARSLLIVFALRAGMGLFTLAALQLLFAIVTVITNVVLVRRLAPQLKIRFNQVDRERLRLIFSFSAYSLLLQSTGYIGHLFCHCRQSDDLRARPHQLDFGDPDPACEFHRSNGQSGKAEACIHLGGPLQRRRHAAHRRNVSVPRQGLYRPVDGGGVRRPVQQGSHSADGRLDGKRGKSGFGRNHDGYQQAQSPGTGRFGRRVDKPYSEHCTGKKNGHCRCSLGHHIAKRLRSWNILAPVRAPGT